MRRELTALITATALVIGSTEGLFAQRRTASRGSVSAASRSAPTRTKQGGTTTVQGERASGSRTVTQTGEGYTVNKQVQTQSGASKSVSKEVNVEDREVDKTSTATNKWGQSATREREVEGQGGYATIEGSTKTSSGREASSDRVADRNAYGQPAVAGSVNTKYIGNYNVAAGRNAYGGWNTAVAGPYGGRVTTTLPSGYRTSTYYGRPYYTYGGAYESHSVAEVMTMKRSRILGAALVAGTIGLTSNLGAQQAAGGGQPDHVAALKQSISEGTKKLAQYEWVETTVINLKGEEKGRKLNRCYYGADGKVQKTPMDQPAAQAQGGGRRGRRGGGRVKEQIVEKKKDEMQDYMERAAALIHSYVPPAPQQIQAVKDGGRIAVTPQPDGRVRLELKQYLKSGDALTIDLDPAANRLLGLGVNSYLDTPDDAIALVVQMNTLPDGALYAAQTTLDAKAKNIKVVITNSGHKPVAR